MPAPLNTALFHEPLLSVQRLLTPLGTPNILPTALHDPCLRGVVQINFENLVLDLTNQRRVFQGKQHLHATVEVAWHQVGAAQVDFFFAAVTEIIDAAVLQEAADNADHLNVLADPRHARPQAANSAHQQADLRSEEHTSELQSL